MCGYCTESAALAQLMDEMNHVLIAHEPLLCPVFLQEASDWRQELASWERLDQPRGVLIALCRHWSECIADASPAPLGDALDADAFAQLQNWLAAQGYAPDAWHAQEVDAPQPSYPSLAQAKKCLDDYLDGWLRASPDSVAWDSTALNRRFLAISIAFDVVAKSMPADARLIELATLAPIHVPSFDGLDLWLQRRSVQACVAQSGVSFIEEHLDTLRFEAILSVVMSNLLDQRDLLKLQDMLHERALAPFNFGVDTLLESTQAKLQSLATGLSRSCARALSGPYQSNQGRMFQAVVNGTVHGRH